jgi:hypothetical protein
VNDDRYPALGHVLGAYYHQDAGGLDHALRLYLDDGAERAAEAAGEADDLLADADEAELARWSRVLGNSWDVPRFGMTYREFFERLREALRAVA